MSDLINGREMLKRYQEDLCYGIACKECSMCMEDGGCRVEEWIDKFPSADRPQGWIPCSERLPDDNREVLISLEWGIDIGTYERGEWRSEWINHYDDDNVLAWMPLPKPYKADRKTEPTISKMEQVDKPQTDCGDFADRLAYERGVKHAWEVAQKVFDSTVTFYEAEDVAKQIDKDINVRSNSSEKPNNLERSSE